MELQSRTSGYSEVQQNYTQEEPQNELEIRDSSNYCSSYLSKIANLGKGCFVIGFGSFVSAISYDNNDKISQGLSCALFSACWFLGTMYIIESIANTDNYKTPHKAG